MKKYLIFAFYFLVCSFTVMSFNVLAQSENATDKSETNIFEIATEEQMQEAREFYQFCKDDPIYSERKNCKCASLRYLETRVEHGDKISKAEILEKNKEACIRSIEGNLEVTKKVDVEEIPQKYIAEAEGIYMECKNDPLHAREYDCNCYAANYLEKRIEGGEFTNQNLIKLNIRGKCPNLVEKTGYEYTQCMSTYMLASAPPGIEAQDFCECYARTWAEQTKNSQGTVSNSAKMQLQVTSRMACRDPALYQTERK